MADWLHKGWLIHSREYNVTLIKKEVDLSIYTVRKRFPKCATKEKMEVPQPCCSMSKSKSIKHFWKIIQVIININYLWKLG